MHLGRTAGKIEGLLDSLFCVVLGLLLFLVGIALGASELEHVLGAGSGSIHLLGLSVVIHSIYY